MLQSQKSLIPKKGPIKILKSSKIDSEMPSQADNNTNFLLDAN